MADCHRRPDVIFVCVKGYSLEETLPFIRRVAHPATVVIPLLNLFGTGGRMQPHLPGLLVADGCIYIAAEIKEPGVILQRAPLFRVVFGVREPGAHRPVLEDADEPVAFEGAAALVVQGQHRLVQQHHGAGLGIAGGVGRQRQGGGHRGGVGGGQRQGRGPDEAREQGLVHWAPPWRISTTLPSRSRSRCSSSRRSPW